MRFFVLKRKIQKVYRDRWWVRAATLVLLLAAVVLLESYLILKLTDIPLPVNVETAPKFAPASAKLKQHELLIEHPSIAVSTGLLLSYAGSPNEVVDIHFDNAQFADETIELLRAWGVEGMTLAGLQKIDYFEGAASAPAPADSERCKTSLTLKLPSGSKPPAKISFFQPFSPGSDRLRLLAMTVDVELLLSFATKPPPGNPQAPGCEKQLQLGEQEELTITGALALEFRVPANSMFYFTFKPSDMKSTWRGKDGFIEPFNFGDEPFRAQGVSINLLTADGKPAPSPSPVDSARSVAGQPHLIIGNLAVGPEELRLKVSGNGVVKTEGQYAGNLFKHAGKQPILATLITMATAAFVAWWLRLVYRLFSRRP